MGNQNNGGASSQAEGQRIVLKLRYRDIILHYSFKIKVSITDIGTFPHNLQGLRLWNTDIVLSRFIILENEQLKNQQVCVFKAGVGIAGITLSKWGGCKRIVMCDTRSEVVSNMIKNCQQNDVKDVYCTLINLPQFSKYTQTYDSVLCTDLFGHGFAPQIIINIWRKLLKVGGKAFMLIPDKKQDAKTLLELVDRDQFKISNVLLTAEEYEASPLFNKLQGQSEFPLLGKSHFYLITLTKLKETAKESDKPAKFHQSQQQQTKKKEQIVSSKKEQLQNIQRFPKDLPSDDKKLNAVESTVNEELKKDIEKGKQPQATQSSTIQTESPQKEKKQELFQEPNDKQSEKKQQQNQNIKNQLSQESPLQSKQEDDLQQNSMQPAFHSKQQIKEQLQNHQKESEAEHK